MAHVITLLFLTGVWCPSITVMERITGEVRISSTRLMTAPSTGAGQALTTSPDLPRYIYIYMVAPPPRSTPNLF